MLDGPEDEGFDGDLCGYGCHAGGVARGSVSVGCEHGTYEVTEKHWRAAPSASQAPQTVHDRSVHFDAEQTLPPDSAAVGVLMEMVNRHEDTLLKLSATVRQLQAAVEALTAQGADESEDAPHTGE